MIRWSPTPKGRYESECGRFLVFAEGRDWLGVDTHLFEQSPGFNLPDAARAWCEARDLRTPGPPALSDPGRPHEPLPPRLPVVQPHAHRRGSLPPAGEEARSS